MKTKLFVCAAVVVAASVSTNRAQSGGGALPAPGFHHVHLNSINPDAAIEFYTKQFPATSRAASTKCRPKRRSRKRPDPTFHFLGWNSPEPDNLLALSQAKVAPAGSLVVPVYCAACANSC